MAEVEMRTVLRNIMRDLRVELSDEFDKNFERQAFFSETWQRRKSPLRPGGTTLVDTGALRRSIGSRIEGDSIVFTTTLPYAAVHNEGGEIAVTERMKRYFWARYYEASGSFGRRKDGSPRRDKRTRQLTTAAEWWKCMALMKVGRKIRIPKRAFLGYAPEVEQSAREIIEENLEEYFNNIKLR